MAVLEPNPRYLREAVRSIIAQTMTQWELVIVEEPSSSSGRLVLAAFDDSRIRYIVNSQRTSLVAQRNRGLAEARAEFVAILDADDTALPERLAKQVAFLESHPEISVVGSQIGVADAQGRLFGHRVFPLAHEEIAQALARVVPISQSSVMFRKADILRAGAYQDHGWAAAEDYDLWSRLIRRGAKLANLPEVLTHYRLHPAQIKAKFLRETIRANLCVKERYWCESMDLRSRLWMWGERVLLCLPKVVIRWLLVKTLYQDDFPDRHAEPSKNGLLLSCAERAQKT